MTRYKVEKTDILHNGKLYPEGSTIELEEKAAEKLADYLVPIREKQAGTAKNNTKNTKTTNNADKTSSQTTPKAKEDKNEVIE